MNERIKEQIKLWLRDLEWTAADIQSGELKGYDAALEVMTKVQSILRLLNTDK